MFAAVRVRGGIKMKPQLKKTLEYLCLSTVNQLVLVRQRDLPMLKKAEGFITWGDIDDSMLEKLLRKRARISGDKPVTDAFLKEKKLGTWKDFLKEVADGKIELRKLGIKPVFRLRPPRKGFGRKGIKKPYAIGGALGYRAADINDLICRMI
ncbi:MAG: 50S ribosomal protein L30 [Candidatus ainarchaeum sp.]|nr:50S ribosomal protein L30 [Candidatus ainarchaeum sp.]